MYQQNQSAKQLQARKTWKNSKKHSEKKRWKQLLTHRKSEVRFLALLIPLLESLYQSLKAHIRCRDQLRDRMSDSCLIRFLQADAISIFLPMIMKCAVVELHKLRLTHALEGETPEERFQDFIQRCQTKEFYDSFFSTYPVLNDCLKIKIESYRQALLRFFTHVAVDLVDIEKSLLKRELEKVTDIQGSGDSHRGSQRVLIIRGLDKLQQPVAFVYKPRSISNEVLFHHFCDWYHTKIKDFTLKTPLLIDKQDHGYCEWISYKTCDNKDDLRYFYSSLGQLTALLLVINGTDLHFENLIAHGRHPVLIDLECIFTPSLKRETNHLLDVGKMCILPKQTRFSQGNQGVNISAIGDLRIDKGKFAGSSWKKLGTDEMHLIREMIDFKAKKKSIPRITKRKTPSIDLFELDFIEGFQIAYEVLMTHRDTLKSDKSPLFQRGAIVTRRLFRSTKDYQQLLLESYHPLLLADRHLYDKHINWLHEMIAYKPHYEGVIKAEISDIKRGDIPYFESNDRDSVIFDSCGVPVKIEVDRSGAEQCRFMLDHLSTNHLQDQITLIRLSYLAYRSNDPTFIHHEKKRHSKKNETHFCSQNLIKHLIDRVVENEHDVTWAELILDRHQAFIGELTGFSFYNGSMGIAFVLAQWDLYHDCLASRKLVNKILTSCLQRCRDQPLLALGLNGYSGLLYAAHHIAACDYTLANDLTSLLLESAETLPIHHDQTFDVMSGISHHITTLLHFESTYSIQENRIHASMDYLKNQCPTPDSFCRNPHDAFSDGTPHPPNLGYAHGIAGVAVAFLKYAKRFNDLFSLNWVKKTLELIDQHFYQKGQYWPDMRLVNKVNSYHELIARPPTWCGGHAGIGFFYLACMDIMELRPQAIEGLNRCIKLSRYSDAFTSPNNLCCGFYGELDFLHYVNESGQEIGSLDAITEAIAKLWNKVQSHQPSTDAFNLFHGLAGSLYLSLRHQHPKTMPCALYW
ncbi:MAG: type 2 lanthipeptide synthetase LanM family protein [Parachlamydiaceae bacterium]